MPRYSTAMRSYSPSTSGVTSELGIVWSSSGGHTHDGVESSIIDGEAYSIFDFRPASRTSTIERDNIQTRNRLALRQFIADTIRQDYNIILDPDTIGAANIIGGSITGNNIAANTITTDLLATDAITSLNYSYTSGNFSTAGTFFNLTDGSIISKQFYIDSSGNAGFSGALSAASGTFSGDISGASGTFTGNLSGSTITGGSISGGTIDIGGFDSASFHVDSDGNMWLGASTYAGAATKFRVSNAGVLNATSATISGSITATSGSIGGITIASSKIYSGTGTYANTDTPFYLDSDGYFSLENKLYWNPVSNVLTISGNITASTITGSSLSTSGSRNVSISTNQITLNNSGGDAAKISFNPSGSTDYGEVNSVNRLRLTTSLGGDKIEMGLHPTSGGIDIQSGGGAISLKPGSVDSVVVSSASGYTQINGLDLQFGSRHRIWYSDSSASTGYYGIVVEGQLNSTYSVRIGELYSAGGIHAPNSNLHLTGQNGGSGYVMIRGGDNPADNSKNCRIDGNGNLTAQSKSFRIQHPILEDKHLIHMAIEGPKIDLIYRGTVELFNGKAYINIDEDSNMTEGTFVALCKNPSCYVTNESGWDQVKGSVDGNILTIECQNSNADHRVAWMVVASRKDESMFNAPFTDEHGDLITEINPED